MRYTTSLLVLALSSAATINAGCFGGHKWVHPQSTDSLQEACDYLGGGYVTNQELEKNIGQPNGDCYHFSVKRIGYTQSPAILGVEKCKEFMLLEINGCERGGKTEHDDEWEVT